MKILLISALALTTAAATSAYATQYSCKTDYFGNYVCNYGGNNTTTTRTDYFGNDVTTGTGKFRGTRQTCRTDYFGNYVCNNY